MKSLFEVEKEYTVPIVKVNLIALFMISPIGLIEFLPMYLLHDISFDVFKEMTFGGLTFGLIKLVLAITIGIFIHELLHGLGWIFFTEKKWKAISFGVKWEYFTPYCHCNEPLKKYPFMLGAALPLFVLGIVPVVVAFITGDFNSWFFGFFFTIAASGDIIAIWMLRKVKKDQFVQDHPSEMGFYIMK